MVRVSPYIVAAFFTGMLIPSIMPFRFPTPEFWYYVIPVLVANGIFWGICDVRSKRNGL